MEETILDQAILFAVKAHAGATRRDGHTPYILHCTETAAIAATMTADLEILAAAVLHDVIEDTDVTAADLQKAFGERITQLVVTLSENKRPQMPPEDTWLIRKEEAIDSVEQSQDPAIKIICLADKLSNLRGIYRDHQIYHEDLWDMFHQKSRAKQGWYYTRLEQALSCLSTTAAFQEFCRLRQELFTS